MRFILILLLSSCFLVAGYTQNPERDILKIGYTQVFLAKESSSIPGLFVEYNRTFLPPITIGVSGGLAAFPGLSDVRDTYKLLTFNLDLNFLYSLLDNDRNQFQLGLGISARSFQYERTDRMTSITTKTNALRPGISAMVNYHYIFDPFLIGFRGSVQNYSENGAVYLLGGFLGLRF